MPLPIIKKKEKSQIGKIIAVAAGKGGVGKSLVAKEIAFSLASQNYSVGILDADFYGPSIRKMCPPDQEAKTFSDGHRPALTKKLKSLSFADFKEGGKSNSIRAPMATQLVSEFLHNTHWGKLDFLVIDCPPGTSDIHLALTQQAKIDMALLVSTPQQLSMLDVRRAFHFFQNVKVPLLGVVENMSYLETEKGALYPFGKGGGEILSQEFKCPLLAKIPLIPKLGTFSDLGFNIQESSDQELDSVKKIFLKICEDICSFSHRNDLKLRVDTPYTFIIEFQDGPRRYKLSDLQRECPCASCLGKDRVVNPNLEAFSAQMVGSYALKIDFKEGCSNGIYPFEWLKGRGSLL